jgi:hypothetical protein
MGRFNVGASSWAGWRPEVVANALDYVINAFLMKAEGEAMMQRLESLSRCRESVSHDVGHRRLRVRPAARLCLRGDAAAIWSRGRNTAAISGATLWLAICAIFAGLTAMGIYTEQAFL